MRGSASYVIIYLTAPTDCESKLLRFKQVISSFTYSNDSGFIKETPEDIVTTCLENCQKRRGRLGPPGRAGNKGSKSNEGRRGIKGSQEIMGPPGKSGKQRIMGALGIRGEKGVKGDIRPSPIPGIKVEPGESIFPPKVTNVPASQLTVNESSTAVFFCSVSGNPTAKLTWNKVENLGTFIISITKFSIVIGSPSAYISS